MRSMKIIKDLILIFAVVVFFIGHTADGQADQRDNLKKECSAENWRSCFGLGFLEKNAKNLTEARRVWKVACDHEYWPACAILGAAENEAKNYG